MDKSLTAKRFAGLRNRMQTGGIDLVALGPGAHMQWLLGFHPHPDERPCLLLIGAEKESFLMPALNAEASRAETDIAFHTWDDAAGHESALTDALKATVSDIGKVRRVALDETMRADFALAVTDNLESAGHCFTGTTVGALRMIKDENEFAILKKNAAINDAAMTAGFAALKPGMTESAVAAVMRNAHGADGASTIFTIVASGQNGAFPHHATGARALGEGDAIVMDIGATYQGYCSDMTRMAIIGTAPEGYDAVHAIVESAVCAALDAARPGIAAKQVDKAARDVITEAGYGEYFVHRTGHGLGIEAHEPPYITSTSGTVLQPGMVFSIEPGIYIPGRFGIRLEEIVFLRDDGPVILSGLPRTPHTVKV